MAFEGIPSPQTELCVSLCEIAPPNASPAILERILADACADAGFPYCERIYAGSYFCENYFCALGLDFHEALRELCARHDMRATLVVPLFGQASLETGERRLAEALAEFGGPYDEVVANDVARFLNLSRRYSQRLGIGRLFSKGMRDARVVEIREGIATPTLSAEALECLFASRAKGFEPLVELDPTAAVVDASAIVEEEPDTTIAMHLPLCYATTGRNCTLASIDEPLEEKFHLGRACDLQCLDVNAGYRTEEGIGYLKHGRTFFYENPACAIAGTSSWRVIYSAMSRPGQPRLPHRGTE